MARSAYVGRTRLGQQKDRSADAGLAKHRAFLDQRHTQPRRSSRERGLTDRDGTVAIAVGLDDRAQLGRPDEIDERLDVLRDGR